MRWNPNDDGTYWLRSRSGVASFTAELPKGGVEVRPLPDWALWICESGLLESGVETKGPKLDHLELETSCFFEVSL